MHIDKFKKDGGYEGTDGCWYESATDFLQIEVLGFCGCGMPEANLAYVRDVLQHIDNLKALVWEEKQTHEGWVADGAKLFSSEGARYFAFYFMASKDFTEHGGSVPGWLTDKGRFLLEDLKEFLAPEPDPPRP